jgi:hypothetical protein
LSRMSLLVIISGAPVGMRTFLPHRMGTGLHWYELDEDISVKALLLGIGDRTKPARKAS